MRVLHVVTQLGTYGGERFVGALARAQRSEGIDARVATIYDSPTAASGDLPVYSAGRRGDRPHGGGALFFFRLVALIRRLRPDVVHTHLAHAKYWGRLAAFAAGARCVVHTEHGNDFRASFPRCALTRLLHRRTARVVALTRAHGERIARYERVPESRITVIPNGVPVEASAAPTREGARRALGVSDGERAVLVLGRLDAVKQPLRALAACAMLPASLHARAYFVGDGPLRDAIANAARKAGIAPRVHLLGYRDDAAALLPGADVVLNASDSEAMPLSLIEALCADIPIVSTPWPGARELLTESSVAEDFSVASLARTLATVLRRERATRTALPPTSRERFSIARSARAYARLYEHLAVIARG